MKKITWKTAIAGVGVVAVLVLAGGAGRMVLSRAQVADTDSASSAQDFSSTSEDTTVPVASFPVPQPLSPEDAEQANAILTGEQAGEPTVTEDKNGDVTIVPDWEAKAANSHPVTGKASANVSGSGGSMDLEDGIYQGDHPKETSPAKPAAPSTPAPKDTEPAEPAPQTPSTPSTDSSTGGPPSGSGSYDGEISADGKYEYWAMFDQWVEIGGGSNSVPGKGTHTEVGGDVVGDM